MRRRLIILLLCLLPALTLPAKGLPVSVEATVKLSSAYLWRGDAVCGFHAAPDFCLNIGNFTVEHYDFLALDGSYKEIDWDFQYHLGDFTFHLADYFFMQEVSPVKENYFNWRRGETTHVDEVALVYDSSVIPLTAKWFTFFWGDWLPDGGPLSFSSYAELTAYHDFTGYGRASLVVGASVLPGSYTGYTRSFMPIHVELNYGRTVEAGKVKFPLGVSFVVNPFDGRCHAAASAGITF